VNFKTSDGPAYPLAISTNETEFKKLGDVKTSGVMSIEFRALYRVRGRLVEGAIEAEEVELLKSAEPLPGKGGATEGMFVPVGQVLPSTGKLIPKP
jgi:hypothetical protein